MFCGPYKRNQSSVIRDQRGVAIAARNPGKTLFALFVGLFAAFFSFFLPFPAFFSLFHRSQEFFDRSQQRSLRSFRLFDRSQRSFRSFAQGIPVCKKCSHSVRNV